MKWKFLLLITLLAAIAGCGESTVAEFDQARLQAPSADFAARALIGMLNISGNAAVSSQNSCGGDVGTFGDDAWSCVGSCSGVLYQVSCRGSNEASVKKSYACGPATFKLGSGNLGSGSTGSAMLNAEINSSQLVWTGESPQGVMTLSAKFDGAISGGGGTSGHLSCVLPMTLLYTANKAMPELKISCAEYSCALENEKISCAELQEAMTADLCERY